MCKTLCCVHQYVQFSKSALCTTHHLCNSDLQILIQIPEVLHFRKSLDAPPGIVWEEANGTTQIWGGWKAKQEVQLIGVNLLSLEEDLEGDLRGECEFVTLKQATRSVHENRISDALYQVQDSLFDLVRWLCSLNGLVEYNTESLKRGKKFQRNMASIKGQWGRG